MRITMTLGTMALVAGLVSSPTINGQESTPQAVEGYVWGGACKECHAAIHESWDRTKHATAINRLSSDERKGTQCIGCHVTGPKEAVMVEGKMVNAGVQCEACHGSGKGHVEAAKAGNPASARLTKRPAAALCQACHNDKSPHYKGFYYNALVGLVHKK
jgi:hypothetical protein